MREDETLWVLKGGAHMALEFEGVGAMASELEGEVGRPLGGCEGMVERRLVGRRTAELTLVVFG